MTRAVGLIAHGHPVAASRLNPAVWMLMALLAWPELSSIAKAGARGGGALGEHA
jgi:hypothetical protein